MKRLQNGTWLACLVGSIALASACGDEDSDNPQNVGGTSGSGGTDTGGKSGKGGTSGSSGAAGSSGSAGKGGTPSTGGTAGTAGTDGPGGDGGVGNEGGGGTGGMPPEACDVYDPNRLVEDIPTNSTGDITFPASNTLTLTNDTTWRINGRIYVGDGKTLNIEPCTLIVGTPKPQRAEPSSSRAAVRSTPSARLTSPSSSRANPTASSRRRPGEASSFSARHPSATPILPERPSRSASTRGSRPIPA